MDVDKVQFCFLIPVCYNSKSYYGSFRLEGKFVLIDMIFVKKKTVNFKMQNCVLVNHKFN